jgi:beta-glucuronidase
MAETVPWLRGMSPWILKDFRSPRRYHGKFQEYWNRKGLISETGARKLAFDTLATFYRGKRTATGAR